MSEEPPLLSLRDVSKTFGATRALDRATLDLRPGQVHALVGQNGSGKSTLIKVLTGFHEPDDGSRVEIEGEQGRFTRGGPITTSGELLHVRAVHQDLGLIGGLGAADNVALVTGYPTGAGARVRWSQQASRTRDLLSRVGGADIDVWTPVELLAPLERTQVAIARALHGWEDRGGVLVLDEPTATLPQERVEGLFELILGLRDGGVSILYVSHRFNEVLELADLVTVLRDGQTITTVSGSGLAHDRLVDLMLGEDEAASISATANAATRKSVSTTSAPTVRVRGLRGGRVDGLDFDVESGEVLGFAGLIGSGQEELPYLLIGAIRAIAGTVEIGDETHTAAELSPRSAIARGVGLVPASRATEALLPGRDLAENLSLSRPGRFQRRGWYRAPLEEQHADRWLRRLDVVPEQPSADVSTLSGGNQQKVVIGRLLSVAESLLVLAEPTAGVDVGAKARIYERLRAQVDDGLAVVVCSTDPLDLVALCSRVIVLRDGRPSAELCGEEITEDALVRATLTRSEAA